MRGTTWSLVFGLGLGLGLATLTPGCGAGGANDECPAGAEACVCLSGTLCVAGLTCVSGYCVNLGGDGGTGDGNSGDGDSGDGDSGDGDGDSGGDVNLCQPLIDCVKQAQPEALSSYVTLYGPEGECFDIAGLTPEDCWAECDAIRETLAMAYPDIAACGPLNCGDGKLDLDEMCDGTDGCTATCRYSTVPALENDCSPVTQVGCDPASERCAFSLGEWDYSFYCQTNSQSMNPADNPNETCFYNADCSYAPNAICEARPDCVDFACCTTVCYLGPTDEDFACPAGYDCISVDDLYSNNPWPDGSELVGVCWPS